MVDLYGDLAGILQISQGNGCKIELKPRDELDNSLLVEIQQIQEMVDSAGTDENCGLQAKQVQMVAGARSHRYLADGNPSKTAISKGTANIFLPLYAVFGLERISQNKVQRSVS